MSTFSSSAADATQKTAVSVHGLGTFVMHALCETPIQPADSTCRKIMNMMISFLYGSHETVLDGRFPPPSRFSFQEETVGNLLRKFIFTERPKGLTIDRRCAVGDPRKQHIYSCTGERCVRNELSKSSWFLSSTKMQHIIVRLSY